MMKNSARTLATQIQAAVRSSSSSWVLLVVLACVVPIGSAIARDLTFEDRVKAQEAIERVYYSHQIGATKPFENAVPRAILENKVRTYLKQTVALETYWKTPVTAEMLRAEMQRMARQTRMPERLRELPAALGNDPFLIQECLARATLVDRLTRNFHAFDPTLHAEARQLLEELGGQAQLRRRSTFFYRDDSSRPGRSRKGVRVVD